MGLGAIDPSEWKEEKRAARVWREREGAMEEADRRIKVFMARVLGEVGKKKEKPYVVGNG